MDTANCDKLIETYVEYSNPELFSVHSALALSRAAAVCGLTGQIAILYCIMLQKPINKLGPDTVMNSQL